jgi:hypothetical protein
MIRALAEDYSVAFASERSIIIFNSHEDFPSNWEIFLFFLGYSIR